jgi:hypothetical protein
LCHESWSFACCGTQVLAHSSTRQERSLALLRNVLLVMAATSFVLCAVIASRSTGDVSDSTTLAELTVLEGRRGVLQGVSVCVRVCVSLAPSRVTVALVATRIAARPVSRSALPVCAVFTRCCRLSTVVSCAVHGAASVQPGVGVAVTEPDELLGSRELEATKG